MRFRRLQLTAYGPFTDQSLIFDNGHKANTPTTDAPSASFHVIYGPNEAGKTSTLAAITDALFGFHARSTADFVHPYKKLRIGFELENASGDLFSAVRRKGNSPSLRTADDKTPIPESDLQPWLSQIDRDTFQQMFGIDHQRLRRGGQEIVSGAGKIGELLFSAGMGIADLQQLRQTLKTESELLFKPRAKSAALSVKLEQYKTCKQQLKQAQVPVDVWQQRSTTLQTLNQQKDELDAQLLTLKTDLNRLERIQLVIPTVVRWQADLPRQQQLASVPDLPPDFGQQTRDALADRRDAEQTLTQAIDDLTQVSASLAELSVDQSLLAESATIQSLQTRLGEYLKAQADRPSLEIACQQARAEAIEILHQLGRQPDLSLAESLRIPAHLAPHVQQLGNQYEGLVARRESSQRVVERLQREIQELETELPDTSSGQSLTSLKATVKQIRSHGDLAAQLDELNQQRAELELSVAQHVSQLPLWSGSLDSLLGLQLPMSTTVDRFENDFRESQHRQQLLDERFERANQSREQLLNDLANLESDRPILTESDLTQARQQRDQAWELIRARLQNETIDQQQLTDFLKPLGGLALPETFTAQLRLTDEIGDTLRADADRVAKKSQIETQLAQQAQLLEQLQIQRTGHAESNQQLCDQWSAAWEGAHIDPLTPQEMRQWLGRYTQIAEQAESLSQMSRKADSLKQKMALATEQLELSLTQLQQAPQFENSELTLADRLDQAEQFIVAQQEMQTIRQQRQATLKSKRGDLSDAQAQRQAADDELKNWNQQWVAAMQPLGLTESASSTQANSVLQDLNRLFSKLREIEDKQLRISGIDADAQCYQNDVKQLWERLHNSQADPVADQSDETRPLQTIITELQTQLQQTLKKEETVRLLAARKQELELRIHQAERQLADADSALIGLQKTARCDQADTLLEVDKQFNERQQLDHAQQERIAEINSRSAGQPFADFLEEVKMAIETQDKMAATIESLDRQIEELTTRRDRQIEQITVARAELEQIDGSDLAAEKSLEAESLAAGIEEDLQRLASYRIATAVLQQAIERHREKNQGPVLSRATEYFARLTCGMFSGLQADYNDNNEPVLKGVRQQDSQLVAVESMSDGTCDQLYLALRLASLATWLDEHEPIPFIVDDILLNFDDQRATAALELLAEFSQHTQLLFFTHHEHLLELLANRVGSEAVVVHRIVPTYSTPA